MPHPVTTIAIVDDCLVMREVARRVACQLNYDVIIEAVMAWIC